MAQGEREGGGEGDPGGEGSTTVASHSDTQAQPGGDGGGGDGGGGGGAKVDMSEVLSFPTNCYNCQSATETRMKLVGMYALLTFFFFQAYIYEVMYIRTCTLLPPYKV